MGLHAGWAVEGAIGSVQKVSINYVSADVRTTSRLAATAVQYGVPLLFSNKLHKMLSSGGKTYCRHLDVIQFSDTASMELR
jgi:class 3 adenylate cyclase